MNQTVQLITVTLLPDKTLKIETIYNNLMESEKPDIYFVDDENQKYEGKYFYGDDIKILFYLPIKNGKFKLKIDEISNNVNIVDNKNQRIIMGGETE